MDILKRILELRTRRGWTEWKLAEESGLKQSTISSWYSKEQLPKIPSLEKSCDAFGITLSQFFCGDGESIDLTPGQREMFENWSALSKKQRVNYVIVEKYAATK